MNKARADNRVGQGLGPEHVKTLIESYRDDKAKQEKRQAEEIDRMRRTIIRKNENDPNMTNALSKGIQKYDETRDIQTVITALEQDSNADPELAQTYTLDSAKLDKFVSLREEINNLVLGENLIATAESIVNAARNLHVVLSAESDPMNAELIPIFAQERSAIQESFISKLEELNNQGNERIVDIVTPWQKMLLADFYEQLKTNTSLSEIVKTYNTLASEIIKSKSTGTSFFSSSAEVGDAVACVSGIFDLMTSSPEAFFVCVGVIGFIVIGIPLIIIKEVKKHI